MSVGDSLHSFLLLFNYVWRQEGGGRRRAHTHPKKRVFDFQGLPIRHALHTGNQVKLFFCFPNSFHGIMNIICPEETPSEIDAALQETFENTSFFFFFTRRLIFLKNLFGCRGSFHLFQMPQRYVRVCASKRQKKYLYNTVKSLSRRDFHPLLMKKADCAGSNTCRVKCCD